MTTCPAFLLFGAGASKFCGGVSPSATPLGDELFDALCEYDQFFRDIAPDLAQEFRANFERGMELFFSREETSMSKFLNKMSRYFLEFRISDSRSNLYIRLLYRWSEMCRLPARFATLNYDLLLEDVFSFIGANIQPLKLHGSPTYLPQIALHNTFHGTFSGAGVAHTEGPVERATREQSITFTETQEAFSPAIAMFAPGKKVLHSPSIVEKIQEEYRRQISEAKAVIIVGVNLQEQDTHVWNPLSEFTRPILIVNPNFEPYRQWAQKLDKNNVDLLTETFSDMLETQSLEKIVACLKQG